MRQEGKEGGHEGAPPDPAAPNLTPPPFPPFPSLPLPLIVRMVSSCFEKCMDRRHKDGDLTVGETACLDRCAAKYWATTGIVGQLLGGGAPGGAPK